MDEGFGQCDSFMKVSIVIPIYNVSAYVERCLQSVKEQTYAQCEVILVDDCGTDDSVAKCEAFISRYHLNWTLLHHERNRGLSAARNTGTEAATGEFVLYVDSDDALTPHCVQDMVMVAEKYPGVQMVQGKTQSVPYRAWYDMERYESVGFVEDCDWIARDFFNWGPSLPVNAWNKLIRLDFIRANGLTFEEGLLHEDEMWMLHTIRFLSKLAFVHEFTYVHYATPESIMSTVSSLGHLPSWKVILCEAAQIWNRKYAKMQMKKYIGQFLYRIDGFPMQDVREIAESFGVMAFRTHCFGLAFVLYRLARQETIHPFDSYHEYLNGYLNGALPRFWTVSHGIKMLRARFAVGQRMRKLL